MGIELVNAAHTFEISFKATKPMKTKSIYHPGYTKNYTYDRLYFLNHELRRPISNIMGISKLMLVPMSNNDKRKVFDSLKKALADFDRVLKEFNHFEKEIMSNHLRQTA